MLHILATSLLTGLACTTLGYLTNQSLTAIILAFIGSLLFLAAHGLGVV